MTFAKIKSQWMTAAGLAKAAEQEKAAEPETVVVTRHHALVEVLRERGLIDDGVRVISHATVDDVRGRRVIGVLPMHLAAEAAEVVVVDLSLLAELRGQELSASQVRAHMGAVTTYVVTRK